MLVVVVVVVISCVAIVSEYDERVEVTVPRNSLIHSWHPSISCTLLNKACAVKMCM